MASDTATFTPESTWKVLLDAGREAGLDVCGAELIRLGENALYKLRSPTVVRIARNARYWGVATKEVQVAQWLAAENIPAAQLAPVDPQPIEVAGHPVTFWQYIDGPVAQPDDIACLGAVLRKVHSLSSPASFELPAVDVFTRVRPRLELAPIPNEDKSMLLERCDQLYRDLAELEFPLPMAPTHGDAHIKNIMFSNGTTVLIDFEAFSWSHPEWDLAVTGTEYKTAKWWTDEQYRQFVDAYGFDITEWHGFETLRAINEIKMTTWIMQNIQQSDDIRQEFESRMRTIRTGKDGFPWRPF